VGCSACGCACSDHVGWHNRGFRASFLHEASNVNCNRLIHTINDTTAPFGNTASHVLKFTPLSLAYAVYLGGNGLSRKKPLVLPRDAAPALR